MSYNFDMALAGATPLTSTTTSSSTPTTASLADIKELQVRFTTSLTSIPPLPSSPFTIPVHLTRYGLSQILNHLLSLPKQRPFDFLIDGQLLRSSLRDVLRERGEVGEVGLLVEVVEAVGRPEVRTSSRPHPDWLSSVWQLPHGEVVTGCYDRHVRVVRHTTTAATEEEEEGTEQMEGEAEVVGSGHTSAVKCVRSLPSPLSTSSSILLSASKDQSIRVWQYSHTTHTLTPTAVARNAHTASVESLAVLEGLSKFVSGGYDKLIYVWDINTRTEGASEVQAEGEGGGKRRKRGKAAVVALAELQPVAVISGSTDVVTGLTSPFPTTLLSCSFDTSLRTYDLPTQQQTRVWHIGGGKPLSSVDVSADGRLAALGCWDGSVRLVDVRSAESKPVSVLSSHTGVVSSVSFSRSDGYHAASGSYDGSVKVWDVRARVPLTTVKGSGGGEDDKVLSVCWSSGGSEGKAGGSGGRKAGVIWSGGSDRVLRQYRWKSQVDTEE